MNRKLAFSLLLGAFAVSSWAQQAVTVKGTVKDSENNPVIGATVVVKGTTIGTTTDIDGNYTINVNPGQVLEFSYVGMQQSSVTVGNKNVINITMADGELLDEVVVIGYGTVKKSHLTGAVSSVSGKELQASVARSASSALQGRIAGVSVSSATGQPGQDMNINIRGVSSLSSTKPLYVIDGVYGDINMVDPNDIQSLEVLKDASAAAIYGSRAANGVVLITTKGGRTDMPTRVEVNAYSGVQTVAKTMEVMNTAEYLAFSKQYNLGQNIPEFVNGNGIDTDWQKETFQSAPVTKVSLNVSGGGKSSTYNVSGSYLNQKGIVKTTGYEAWNIRAKNTFSAFNNHLRIGSTVLLKMWNKDYDDLSYSSALRNLTMVPVYDSNNPKDGTWGYVPSWGKGADNPVGWVETHDYQRHGVDLLLNGYAEVDLGLKGLKYKFNVGAERLQRRSYNHTSPFYFGPYSEINVNKLSEGHSWDATWMIENTLHYDNTFGKHTVSGLLGYSSQRYNYRSLSAGRDGLTDGIFVMDNGTSDTQTNGGSAAANTLVSLFARGMYSFDDRYMISASVRRDGSSKFADGHRYGVFPSASVGWNIMNEQFFENAKEKVNELKLRVSYGTLGNLNGVGNYATQSVVNSGYNAVQGGSWWLGSTTGASWVSPEDLTWEKTKTFNVGADVAILNNKLSLAADYFIQRTDGLLLGINQPGSAGMSGTPTYNAAIVENKGVEISLNHRNTVGEVYYHVGVNLSAIKNNLKEITTPTKQEFTGYNPHDKGNITWAKVGKPIGSFYLVKTDGIFQNQAEIDAYVNAKGEKIQPNAVPGDLKFIDYDGDGDIDNLDQQYCGSPFPKLSMGLTMGVEYKGIDLNLFFDGNFGNKIYNGMRFYSSYMDGGMQNLSKEMLNAWTETNTNTDVPRYVTGTDLNNTGWAITDRWLENGSYFRLKTLELGYTLPKAWTSKALLQSVRIYTAMDNLFTITSYKGYTPDLGVNSGDGATGQSDNVMTRGCDDGRYPSARSFTFGLQVNF
ncbi:TonB-dependent receptor [Parabacteroides gordonii]|jgi:TonB-linked SusC/RagA family outer membrane protein|uniref:SusC/RagA family TonB-linked outer membrane protein n=1 Tax=Parabacteroides gordonii TaxID=574930 RepID=UPI00241D9381|nr:TonB-dependent receptor [Parabacteroides gordonii]